MSLAEACPPESEPKRRQPRLKPSERRELILTEAVAFFAEVGLEGRTRDLSARLGITQSLLYKYFSSKEELLEAVFERVYLDRLRPEWREWLLDRSQPLRTRMLRFYEAYTSAIFDYEWLRIFMFAGLAGAQLNNRYFGRLSTTFLEAMLVEIRHEAGAGEKDRDGDQVEMEDIWNLHGSIVYLGIRKFVYQVPTPADLARPIARSIDRFLHGFGIDPPRNA